MTRANTATVFPSELITAIEGDIIENEAQLQEFLDTARRILQANPIEPTADIRSAGLILRISDDTKARRDDGRAGGEKVKKGYAWGVKRQLVMTVQVAERKGWGIADIYCDNSVTAFKGGGKNVVRPEYERLRDDIAADVVDGVLCQDQDRLFRDRKEYLEFEALCVASSCRHLADSLGKVIDFDNMDDQVMATIKAAFAEKDSRLKGKKVRESYQQKARLGEANLSVRGYGYDFGLDPARGNVNTLVVRQDEAEVIRVLRDRFLAGESVQSLTKWLEQQGIKTIAGGPWRSNVVSTLLQSGRIAGLREYKGEVVGVGNWEPIISVEDHERIMARYKVLHDRAVNARSRLPRKYALSGLLRCGAVRDGDDDPHRGEVCGGKLYSSKRYGEKNVRRRYVCRSGPDHGGCGRLTVVAEPLEDLVIEAVLRRLDSPKLADALAGKVAENDNTAVLAESLARDEAELTELARMKAQRRLSMTEWVEMRDIIDVRMTETRRKLEAAFAQPSGGGAYSLMGQGARLREQWSSMDVSAQLAALKTVLVEVVIMPGGKGRHGLDKDRARPVWRHPL